MKQLVIALLLLFGTSEKMTAQTPQTQPYKVVFDLTDKDTSMHTRVMRWIDLILKTNKNPELEVVFYGQSLDMVTKGKSCVESDVAKLAALKNVKFAVCEHAMMVHNISKDMLIPGVITVPDGIYEIITKEGEGYGYIKASK